MAFQFPSLGILLKGAISTLKRFPFTVVTAILASGIGIFLLELKWDEQKHYEYLYKVIMCGWLGLNLFLALTLFSERKGHSQVLKYALQVIALGLLVGYYFTLPEFKRMTITDGTRYALFSVGLHLFVAFSPFIGRGEVNGFWQFNKTLFLRFLLSALYAAVLFVGLALALAAIDKLFKVDIRGERYGQLWIFMAGIFNTWFFLSGVPSNLDELEATSDYPKGLKIFTQFVLLPLVTVYLVILYAYGIKILIQWQLPQGWVSYLVNAFSVFGILSLLLIFPIRNDEGNKWMNIFSRWFYRALFPLIVLLGVAIGKRVIQYGITENRYFVLVVALWLTGIATYFLLSKTKNIKVIPVSLCIIAFLSSFGPWGAFSVSEKSQVKRLEKLLVKENILVNGKIKKRTDSVSYESTAQISSIIHYLDDHHHYDAIKPWFKENLDSVLAPKGSNDYVYEEGKIFDLMGIQDNYYGYRRYDQEEDANDSTRTRNFNYYVQEERDKAIPVGDFDYYCSIEKYFSDYYSENKGQVHIGNDSINLVYLEDSRQYAIVRNEKDSLYLEIKDLVKKLSDYEKANKNEYGRNFPQDKMVLEAENSRLHVRMYVAGISGTINQEETVLTSINGTMLVKFKTVP